MKILITGIGITGKSTFRRMLVQEMRRQGLTTHHFDADQFDHLRHPADQDLLPNLPKSFDPDHIYIIEDVHGPTTECYLPLSAYDLILYLMPTPLCHLNFIIRRFSIWWQQGRHSWEANLGWQGTGQPHDLINLPGLIREFFHIIKNKKNWIKNDLIVIQPFNHQIIKI